MNKKKSCLILIILSFFLAGIPFFSFNSAPNDLFKQPPVKKYDAIIFDLFGVLIKEVHGAYYPATMAALHMLGASVKKGRFFSTLANLKYEYSALRAPLAENVWSDLRKGLISEEKAADQVLEAVMKTLQIKELKAVGKEGILYYLRTITDYTYPLSDSVALLKKIKQQGYKTYLLSNVPKEEYERLLKNPKIASVLNMFDGKICSHEVHAQKPDQEIYQALLTTFNLDPCKCFFMDDKKEYVNAAYKLGIESVVFINAQQVEKEMRDRKILGG